MTLQEIKNRIPEFESKIDRKINLWEKGQHKRLYVNRNNHKCYGYIDLNTMTVHGYGNQVSVDELFNIIKE